MREIVTAVEMKELDHNTIQKAGISSPVLMERAALKTVEEIVQRLKNKEKEKILVVCGTGNNGGDGLAIARLLQLRGVRTWYYIAGKEEKMTAETAGQLKTAEYYQVPRVHNLDPDEYTTIVESWEEVKAEDKDKMILHIDPGTAFGTGMHETTQLVIRQLKKYVTPDTEMLDVGTGSAAPTLL